MLVWVGALRIPEVAHLRRKESQLLDSVMTRNFRVTRNAMHCDGARTRAWLGPGIVHHWLLLQRPVDTTSRSELTAAFSQAHIV